MDVHNTQAEKFRAQLDASEPLKKQLWQQTISAKLSNQSRLLKKMSLNPYTKVRQKQLAEASEYLMSFSKDVKSGDGDNHEARGAAICGLVAGGLTVAEYTALQVKKAVVGNGKAQKSQVQEMVQRLLLLPGLPGTDAADALGVAICHAHSGEAMARLGQLAPSLARKGLRVKAGRLIG